MKIRKKYRLTVIMFGLALSSYAQDGYKLSINELLDLGIQNSLKIKFSQIKTEISVDKEILSKIGRLPDIIFSATNGYVGDPSIYDKDLSHLRNSNTPDWMQNYNIQLSQPLYEGGKIKKSIEKASIEKEIANLNLDKDKSDLKLLLISNYLLLFKYYKESEVFSKNIEEAEERLKNTISMKNQGMITNNDVLRNEILLTNYKLSLQETQNNIAIVSQQLDVVLGFDENLIIVPDTLLLGTSLPLQTENDYIEQAYIQLYDLKILKNNTELAKNHLRLERSKYLPSLFLNAGNTLARPITSSSPIQDLYINSWTVTLGLSYKISSWFDHKRTIGIAKRDIELQNTLEDLYKQDIRTNIRSSYVKHKEAIDRISYLTKSVEQAEENYRIMKNKYFNQLAILTDLLDAASVQLNTELQLTAAKTNTLYTYYKLQNVSGNL